MKYKLIFIAVVSVAFILAKYYQKQGYGFWRTFVFSILMILGIGLLFAKALK